MRHRDILDPAPTGLGAKQYIQASPQCPRCSAIATAAVLKCAAPHRNRPLPNIRKSPSPSGPRLILAAGGARFLTPFSPLLDSLPSYRTPRSKSAPVSSLAAPRPPRNQGQARRLVPMPATRAAAYRNHIHDTPREPAGRRRMPVNSSCPPMRCRFSRAPLVSLQGPQRFSAPHRSRPEKRRSICGHRSQPRDANHSPR